MEYIALDIETTGLDPSKHSILEIGMVATDTEDKDIPLDELRRLHIVLIHSDFVITNYCAVLHKNLFAKIQSLTQPVRSHLYSEGIVGVTDEGKITSPMYADTVYCTPPNMLSVISQWLRGKVTVAGKNVASFDIPFLAALSPAIVERFYRRVIDPAILCLEHDDTCLPDLGTCLSRCGCDRQVSHTAIEDCMDVISILRERL